MTYEQEVFNYLIDLDKYTLGVSTGLSLNHYTTLKGLKGITDKDRTTFWFTQYNCLNDPNEGIYILQLLQSIVNENKEYSAHARFCDWVLQHKQPDNEFIAYRDDNGIQHFCQKKCTPFICSFCTNNDLWKNESQQMFKQYANKNGEQGCVFNIPAYYFDEYYLGDRRSNVYSKLKLYYVIYDYNKQRKLIKQMLALTYKLFLVGKLNDAEVVINNFLCESSLAFKEEKYKNEKEVRAVMYVPVSNNVPQGINQIEILHRRCDNQEIPYIEVPLNRRIQGIVYLSPFNDAPGNSEFVQYIESIGCTSKIVESFMND